MTSDEKNMVLDLIEAICHKHRAEENLHNSNVNIETLYNKLKLTSPEKDD